MIKQKKWASNNNDKKLRRKISFTTIGKSILPAFHVLCTHFYKYLLSVWWGFFLFEYLEFVLLDVLDALLSAWFLLLKFSILLTVREVWFAHKQVYTGESTVLGRTRKIYRQDITHCTVHLSNITCSLHQMKPLVVGGINFLFIINENF